MARRALSACARFIDGPRQETFRLFSSTPIAAAARDHSGVFRQQASNRPRRSDDPTSSRPGPSRHVRSAGRSGDAYTGRHTTHGQSAGRTGSNHSSPNRPQKKAFGLRLTDQDALVTIHAQTERRGPSVSNQQTGWSPLPTRSDNTPPSPLGQRASRPIPRDRERPPASDPVTVPAVPSASQQAGSLDTSSKTRSWRPTKKLTYQAMAGLRALHANHPVTFDRNALSERFGISYEAVNRILRSKYQDRKGGETGKRLEGTKWDLDARSSRTSPVPAVKRAFAGRQK